MIKPSLHQLDPNGIKNEFRERKEKVNISIDLPAYDTDCDYNVYVQVEPLFFTTQMHSRMGELYKLITNGESPFDLVLGWEKQLVEAGASKFIFGTSWIDWDTFKVVPKVDEVSFLTTDKMFGDNHMMRLQIYHYLIRNELPNFTKRIYKSYSGTTQYPTEEAQALAGTGPRLPSKNPFYESAKFSIIVENDNCENWITEKLIDALATKTIPIYCGCPNVGEFFDESGIITFSSFEELREILDTLKPEVYDDLKTSVEKNYQLSQEYLDFHSRIDMEIDKRLGK